ncbi:hypothetical protein GCM10011369_36530 [Neiella marina]|uniref:mannan endo-1,4-beta-mannosidase n=2 Tax=Neiella marina TaxID=508461 RepID=A0A8J2UB60_9GAMM|nr:hypothetical protein GCM10011369_36530 [Neiella marina]
MLALSALTPAQAEFDHFITVDGTKLMDGDQEFRFLSFNVPTLNYIEDEMDFDQPNPYGLPSEFELHDLYKTVNELGGRVIRSYTIPVRNVNFPKDSVTYVEAPGVFNEAAFKKMDLALALAEQYGIRVVVPLLNNWQWMGGRPNYADFRGKTKDEFWTDRQLIEDFKKTIHYVLNRTNTITGVKYKDDKTIMAWETGNELENPPEWAIEIARYIKSLDSNHLLIDGYNAIHLEDYSNWIKQYSIDEPAIDMINTHHYEVSPTEMVANIKKTVAMVGGKKPVFLGEFGFISTTGIEKVLDYVISEPAIPGTFIWSLRRHHPRGGFYHHSEPVGYGLYRAYHWPGFTDGEIYDERNLLKMYRRKAFEIQGKPVPPISPAEPPVLLPFSDAPTFSWQGSMGAAGYNIERADSATGPWQQIQYNIEDIDTPGFDLYSDTSAEVGRQYYYRVKTINSEGLVSAPSNVVGPVTINYLTLVDKARNVAMLDESKGVTIETWNYRSYKEAFSRLHGDEGAVLRYYSPGEELLDLRIYAYEKGQQPMLEFFASDDGVSFEPIEVKTEQYASPETNYDYLVPRLYQTGRLKGTRYVKMTFKGTADVVRAELDYR